MTNIFIITTLIIISIIITFFKDNTQCIYVNFFEKNLKNPHRYRISVVTSEEYFIKKTSTFINYVLLTMQVSKFNDSFRTTINPKAEKCLAVFYGRSCCYILKPLINKLITTHSCVHRIRLFRLT